jgi:protein TonB
LNIKRYFNSFFVASIFYSFLIITLLYSVEEVSIAPSKTQHSIQNVKFTLINLPKEIEKPKVEKQEIVKKEPQPKKIEPKIVKKINHEKISPKKIVKKIEPKIEKKEIVKKTEEIKKQIVANQIKKSDSIEKKETVKTDLKQLKMKQHKYYSQIKQTIDKNKSYPQVAVRRGIQGEVKIQFTISKDGELLSYKILDGQKIFFKSISEAIQNSFPLTPPNDIFTSNLDLKLTLHYKLY